MLVCRICHNAEDNKLYVVREMQFGLRDEFEYFECARCGCLQIKEIPGDLSRYYPQNYYSYSPAQTAAEYTKTGLRGYKERFIRDQITKHYLNRDTRLGAWLEKKSSVAGNYCGHLKWMRFQQVSLKLGFDSSILDVGCGSGQLLHRMAALGFSNLMGIDPFIERDIVYDNGVRVLKRELGEVEQQFDFIMLHHSFEHMPDPLATLKKLYALLKPNRYVLIRIPVAGSYAWRKYGVDWASLDAPRHLHLHTRKSMQLLAERAKFQVADVVFDGDGFGIVTSEQYLKDIPLMDPKSPHVNAAQTIFAKEELDAFLALDEELNKKGEADAAGFYLYKA
jgi:SAM-dependent methyltransferase